MSGTASDAVFGGGEAEGSFNEEPFFLNHDSTDSEMRFQLREESFTHGNLALRIALPISSEDLIDEAEFGADERLPYWAELWPSARALARFLLDEPSLDSPAIELGCGVALPSLALRHRGIEVLATDYYEDALRFADHNARLNGYTGLETLLLDWRRPPEDLQRFPLVVAADVLYEERNGRALLSLLPGLLEPGGQVVIADPGRVYLGAFRDAAATAGWSVDDLPERLEDAPTGGGRHVTIRLIRLRRTAPP